MKAMLLLATILGSGWLYGQPIVHVIRIEGSQEAEPILAATGGRPATLVLEIAAADAQAKMNVRARLYQLADSVAAPLGGGLPVAQDLSFDPSLARIVKWKAPLPEVRHVTAVELRFETQAAPAAGWQAGGAARLLVYPGDVAHQVKEFVDRAEARGAGRITVFGDSPALRTALTDLTIPFEDAGRALPKKLDASMVYMGEGGAAELDDWSARLRRQGRLVLFTEDTALLPGIYWTGNERDYVAKVTLPLLAGLAHSPRQQSAFLNLLEHTLIPPPTSSGTP
jgi:hypothetical protein